MGQRAQQLSHEDSVELDLCHQASPGAGGEHKVPQSTLTPHVTALRYLGAGWPLDALSMLAAGTCCW